MLSIPAAIVGHVVMSPNCLGSEDQVYHVGLFGFEAGCYLAISQIIGIVVEERSVKSVGRGLSVYIGETFLLILFGVILMIPSACLGRNELSWDWNLWVVLALLFVAGSFSARAVVD